jgi:hypothetical protein
VTPQELYEKLLNELSASGSTKITTPEGEDLTLRQAIEQIFTKERAQYRLADRPRSPAKADDHYGHTMNARAEGLYTQALLDLLAQKAGIDTKAVYNQVKDSLK